MEIEIDEEVTESSSTSSRNATRRTSSEVWQYFEKIYENRILKKARCNKCKQVFSANGTSNLKRHHNTYCCFRDSTELVGQNFQFNQDEFRDKVAKATIRHNLPFNFVEYEGIREVFSYCNSLVKHISRNTVKADILKIYQVEKEKLKKELESIHGRISLTSDMWTSIASNGYMTVTAHYIDNNWVLQSRVLIFRHVPPPHDGVTIGEKFIDFLQEWGIEKKVSTITLDNAAYNDGVVNSVRDHLCLSNSLVCNGKFIHVRCANHVLNLVVQSGLATIDESVWKIRESVKYVRGSESRTNRFAECVKALGLKTKQKLKQDLAFRWNSTYLMIMSALEYKRAFVNYKLFDNNFKFSPSHQEWVRVEKIAAFLKPFYEMTVLFSGSKYPTANLYFQSVWQIQRQLNAESQSTDPAIKAMAVKMKPKFEKYWTCYSPILSFAQVLDPRYKFQYIKFAYDKLDATKSDEKVKLLREEMQEMFAEYLIHSTQTSTSSSIATEISYDPYDEFEVFQSEQGARRTQCQLESYLAEDLMPRMNNEKLDVLEYWKGNFSKYPMLSVMARDILSIPITSIASESVFSHGGRILGKFRSSLLPDNAKVLLCARDWLEAYDHEDEEVERLSTDIQQLIAQIGSGSSSVSF